MGISGLSFLASFVIFYFNFLNLSPLSRTFIDDLAAETRYRPRAPGLYAL